MSKKEEETLVERINRLSVSSPLRLPNGSVLYPANFDPFDVDGVPSTAGTYHSDAMERHPEEEKESDSSLPLKSESKDPDKNKK